MLKKFTLMGLLCCALAFSSAEGVLASDTEMAGNIGRVVRVERMSAAKVRQTKENCKAELIALGLPAGKKAVRQCLRAVKKAATPPFCESKLKKMERKCNKNNGKGSSAAKKCIKKAKNKLNRIDVDGDCTNTSTDNCPDTANPDQADGDGDTVGDSCDNCSSISNADQADTDSDTVGNSCDNCPSVSNAGQADEDSDNTGDLCEIVDVAVADDNGVVADHNIFIYRDVRNGDSVKEADVELNNATSGIQNPAHVLIGEGALMVSNPSPGTEALATVTIFNNFSGLTTNQAPSTILNNAGSGIHTPGWLVASGGDLAVADPNAAGNNDVRIFRDISTLVSNQAPDAILNAGGSMVDVPVHLYVDGDDRLFVSNNPSNTANDTVTIYNNFSSLATGAAPSVTLNNATSRIQNPERLLVHDNRLYVLQDDPSEGSILIFNDADSLANNQAPDVFIPGAVFAADSPEGFGITGGRLWMCDSDEDTIGLKGWNSPSSLTESSTPDIWASTYTVDANDLRAVAGSVFVAAENFNAVMVYINAAGMTDDQAPDVFLVDRDQLNVDLLDAKTR